MRQRGPTGLGDDRLEDPDRSRLGVALRRHADRQAELVRDMPELRPLESGDAERREMLFEHLRQGEADRRGTLRRGSRGRGFPS